MLRARAALMKPTMNSMKFWVPVFALAIFITHVGSLSREVIVWDESTFILMAANVLDGNLPYVELTDPKPPLIFFLLAGAMWALGESLLTVRLVGWLCILTTGIAVFAIARRHGAPGPAALAALMFIAMSSVDASQYTGSELPAAALLMLSIWTLVAGKRSPWRAGAAGLLMSLAVLARSNLGIAAAALGAWLLLGSFRPSLGIDRRAVAAYVAAGLAVPALLVLLYWYNGALPELRIALIDISLSNKGHGPVDLLRGHVYQWYELIREEPLLYGIFALATVAGMTGVVRQAARRRVAPAAGTDGEYTELLYLMCGAICLSFLVGWSRPHHHYWLQVFPILTLFCAVALDRPPALAGKTPGAVVRRAGYALALVCMASALWTTAPSAIRLIANPGGLAESHYVRRAAHVIAADRRPDADIWALRYHLILWYLDMPSIIAPLVQPSAIVSIPAHVRSRIGHNPAVEWDQIVMAHPAYIVTDLTYMDRFVYYLDEAKAEDMRNLVDNHYFIFYDDGRIRIYKRLEKPETRRLVGHQAEPARPQGRAATGLGRAGVMSVTPIVSTAACRTACRSWTEAGFGR